VDYVNHQNNSRVHFCKTENVIKQVDKVSKQTENAKKQIAFFDFDGTITTKDTLLEFIKFSMGKFRCLLGFILNLNYLVGYKLGVISNHHAKERILMHFFKNTTLSTFENYCAQFSLQMLPALVRPGATAEIRRLIDEGTAVVIVTASAENWVKPWADSMGVELIGTRLELQGQKLTGRIQDINCHGEEKVKRIKQQFTLAEYEKILAYGDTAGDKAMMAIAHESFYKPFRNL
jgi:phosphatidylglycerophosphatase C